MPNKAMMRASGLRTFNNALSSIPEGALLRADNVVIDKTGVIEPRRGFKEWSTSYGTASDRSKQLLVYKERILHHFGSTLQFDSDGAGTLSSFNGSYSEVETGLRIKGIEANGNFYFTTSAGIKKISAETASDFTTSSGFIEQSGGVKALDLSGSINYTTSGFFDAASKVAYRVVWAKRDANNNLIAGVPSTRVVITNFEAFATGTVDLEFRIPSSITTADTEYFYQIYRTEVVAGSGSTIDPGDEMNLIIEDFPTAGQLTAKTVTLNDNISEDFRQNGEFLYTNPNSGEGILQANEVPPLAKDITSYRNTVFYANTETKHRLDLALLSVNDLVSSTSTIDITDGTTTNTYTFVGATEVTDVQCVADSSGSLNDTYFYLFSARDEVEYYVWYNVSSGGTDPAISGKIGIEVAIATNDGANTVASATQTAIDALSDFGASVSTDTVTITNAKNGNTTDASDAGSTGFTITVTTQGDGEDTASLHVLLSSAATVSQRIDETARSLVKVINANTSEIVEAFYLSGENDIPGLILLESKNLGDDPFYLNADSTTTGEEFNPVIPTSGQTVISDNEVKPNRLYFSKFQEPEAVPVVNFIDVGARDKEIFRILSLRESMFILKEDGIFRLTGEAGNFVIDLFDNSTFIIAPDSAAVLNNQIYMLSTQGIIQVSDTGVQIVSRDIEDKISQLSSANFAFKFNTFGIGYETDRAYLLFTVSETTDTQPTQCFRYNVLTDAWTRLDLGKRCGLVNENENILYLGPNDENFVEKERKNFLDTDYADRETTLSLADNPLSGTTLSVSSASALSEGDVLVQTQKLTIFEFNLLLKKLDIDAEVNDTDYESTLGLNNGANLRNALDSLAAKLDLDSGVVDTDYAATIGSGTTFADYQTDYNLITAKLNADAGVLFTNYPTSSGDKEYQVIITAVSTSNNTVTIVAAKPLIVGTIIAFSGITCTVEWAPEHFGDPSIRKHFREGTFLFADNSFTRATVGYKSDLTPSFEEIDFTLIGNGLWGDFEWGGIPWGGLGSNVPLRTYIPRAKQKSRFLEARFKHTTARQKFEIYGISYTARGISERAYRN